MTTPEHAHKIEQIEEFAAEHNVSREALLAQHKRLGADWFVVKVGTKWEETAPGVKSEPEVIAFHPGLGQLMKDSVQEVIGITIEEPMTQEQAERVIKLLEDNQVDSEIVENLRKLKLKELQDVFHEALEMKDDERKPAEETISDTREDSLDGTSSDNNATLYSEGIKVKRVTPERGEEEPIEVGSIRQRRVKRVPGVNIVNIEAEESLLKRRHAIKIEPRNGWWQHNSEQYPITVIGIYEHSKDGRKYYQIQESEAWVPIEEVTFISQSEPLKVA